MADSSKYVRNLVTRLCAAKVCQNYERYPVIKRIMEEKSEAMHYGRDLTKIPPFAFSHLLYEAMGKYENEGTKYSEYLELYQTASKAGAVAADKAPWNTAVGDAAKLAEMNRLEAVLEITPANQLNKVAIA